MTHTALLILYNPYYENNVIESHLAILKAQGSVAFGKIRSKMRTQEPSEQPTQEPSTPAQILEPPSTAFASTQWERLIASISSKSPLQLFLSDYANLYVCKVTAITKEQIAQAPCLL